MTNQKTLSCGAGRFDISTAGLHILAMTLMLMDHLWATLLPAQEWLTCAAVSYTHLTLPTNSLV